MDARQREEVNLKNILLSCVSCVVLTGCYTQLAMFYPEPEIEQDEEQFYETYSRAVPRPNITIHAQTGAGTPLGIAYSTMYNRFYGMYSNWGNNYSNGYYNPYYFYNSYGYHWGFSSYNIGGYKMYIPYTDEKKPRTWSTDRGGYTPTTKLKVTRTRTNTTNRVSDPYPVQDTPRQDTFNNQRPSSNDSGGRRATRRN